MNPNHDRNENENGSGNEDSCEFREGVQIDEDDTSMGFVNDGNDGPFVNGLIQTWTRFSPREIRSDLTK
jgi:hypothetical protein